MADSKTVKADFVLDINWLPVWWDGPCKEAIWLASLLMTNDRSFAAEIVNLAWQKNQIENLRKAWIYSDKNLNERLHTIDEKINLFIEAKLLAWQWKYYSLWAEARWKLIKHLQDAWWAIDRDYQVLTALVESDIINKTELTELLADWVDDAEEMIAKFDDAFAKYVIAKETMRETQWIKRELSDKIAKTEKKHMNTSWKKWWWTKAKTTKAKSTKANTKSTATTKTTEAPSEPGESKVATNIEQPRLFRRESAVEDWYETLTEKEARRIVYKYFDSDEITVVFADNIRTPEWQKAFWEYFDWMIKFARNPAKYTPEHEIVHAYMDLFLTDWERQEIYIELKNLLSQQDFDFFSYAQWLWLDFMRDSIEVYEEILADMFVDYVKSRSTVSWRLKVMFTELWSRVKKMFWLASESKIDNLYQDILKKRRRTPRKTVWQVKLQHTKWDGTNLINNFDFWNTYEVRLINESALWWWIQRNIWWAREIVAERQIARTILWYDTNINWWNLAVSIDEYRYINEMRNKESVLWFYDPIYHHLYVWEYKETVQHEMTHWLDVIWWNELCETWEDLTEIADQIAFRALRNDWIIDRASARQLAVRHLWVDDERADLLVEFVELRDNYISKWLRSTKKSRDRLMRLLNERDLKTYNYLCNPGERFARFWETFIEWVSFWWKVSTDAEKKALRTDKYDEVFDEKSYKAMQDWLSHMADARERWALYGDLNLTRERRRWRTMYSESKKIEDIDWWTWFTSSNWQSNIRYRNWVRIWGESTWNDIVESIVELQDRAFRWWMSIIDLASKYAIPIVYADDFLDLFYRDVVARTIINWDPALWDSPVKTLILIRKAMDSGTLSHELFHGVLFNNVPKEIREWIINDTMSLYNLSYQKANEMLADLFMDYFHTWKFELPKQEHLEKVPWLKDRILKVFETIRNWLRWVDKYETQLQKLYDDILDLKFVDESRKEELDIYWVDPWVDYVWRMESAWYWINDVIYKNAPKWSKNIARITYKWESSNSLLSQLMVSDYNWSLLPFESDDLKAQILVLNEANKNPYWTVKDWKEAAKKANDWLWIRDKERAIDLLEDDAFEKREINDPRKPQAPRKSKKMTKEDEAWLFWENLTPEQRRNMKEVKDWVRYKNYRWENIYDDNDEINEFIVDNEDELIAWDDSVWKKLVKLERDNWNTNFWESNKKPIQTMLSNTKKLREETLNEGLNDAKYRENWRNKYHKDDAINKFIADSIEDWTIDTQEVRQKIEDMTNKWLISQWREPDFKIDSYSSWPRYHKDDTINNFINEHIKDWTIDEPWVQAELDKMLRDWQLKNWEEPTWLPRLSAMNRAKADVGKNITAANIKSDPVLQAEYNSRISAIKLLQELNNQDIEYLRNFLWFFATDNSLFWTALVKDLWSSTIDIAMRYLKKWEDVNTMTVADLRKRMQDVKEKFKDAHKQKNVIAQMEKDRVDWNSIVDMFQVKDVTVWDWIPLKVNWRMTKEWISFFIRDSLEDDSWTKKPKTEKSPNATKVDTGKKWWWKKVDQEQTISKEANAEEEVSNVIEETESEIPVTEKEKEEKVAETWQELEEKRNKDVNTKDDVNPEVNDPATKTELSNEAEQILKENIEKDVEQVKKWDSPSNVASADEIWKEFWERSDDTKKREMAINNYLLWKIYLWEWDDVLESALKYLEWKNLEWYWRLSLKQIDKISDLSQLEQVVFTHIWDLIYNKELREAMKNKQYELWTSTDAASAEENTKVLSKSRSMQKTAEFLEAWWQYTNVSLYDRVWNALKSIFDINSSVNNRDLYDEFVTAVTNYSSKKKSWTTKVWWIDMSATDLVKWLYAISWDDLVKDIASLKVDPDTQIKIAAKRLFDIWDEKSAKAAENKIRDLFNSVTPQDLTNADVTKLAYATTSAVKIEWDMTDDNVVFYNYRDWLYAWDPQTAYWVFFDELAKQNSLIIDTDHKISEVFKVTDIPSNVKYIIVNDINRRDDKELKDFIYSIPEELRPQVIYPRWWMMGNYYVEDWTLKFKTTNWQLYKEITRDASAQTLWAFARNIEEITEESMKELEDVALEYFRTMMWLNKEWAPVDKAEYKAWVINNLRMMTWLPVSAEMDTYNPNSTWKMASDIIRYQLWATGKYTKTIKNTDEIITEINTTFNSNREKLFNTIKWIVWWNDDIMSKNAEAIRDAYINYSVAPTIEAKIQSKWVLMALCNWWEYESITVDLFNWALRNDDFVSVLWPVIYWNREYTKEEIDALNRLWDDILSSYIFDLWSNIMRSHWYSMPLVSPGQTIRKLLKWEDIMNDDFTQAFIKKNWLQENRNLIESILRDALPDSLDIEMPSSLLLNPLINLSNIVVDEIPNVIIPTNYNQLLAIIKKSWSRWWWVTFEEESIIQWILDNYYKAVRDAIDAWIMTPTLAQQLKLQAWRALDMAEQDLLISKYDWFLTLEQRNWLMWWKYKLRIATSKEELESVKIWNQDIINWYRWRLWEMWKDWIKNYTNPEQARKDLIEKWKVMTTINWRVVTMNVHDLLIQEIQTLPEWLKWVYKNFEKLTVNDIKWIPYQQAYAMIKAIDLAKNAVTRGNLYARLMYKQNPQLANISFFSRYTLNSDWVPYALQRNAAKLIDSSISDWVDTSIKQNIMLDISQVMKQKWKLTDEDLDKIIKKELSIYEKDDVVKNHYTNMFKAYTYLTTIPKDIKNTINKMLDVQLKEIRNEISWIDNDFFEWLLNTRVTVSDGTEMTIWDLISWDIDAYRQNLFIEKWSDWVYREIKPREFTSWELWLTDDEILEFSDSMYSMLNQLEQVSEVERKMTSVILWDVRQMLNKYTTTKKLIDADYLVWWANDLVKNLIKSNAFSSWWKLWWAWDMISRLRWKFSWKTFFNKNNWNTIKEYYYTYYRQSLDSLERMNVSNDLQATALEMAKYFKRIEEALGSSDWVRWASISTELNRAFWKLWTVLLNINTASQVHSLMEAIWNNQILAFFKFAKKWDWAYFDLFSNIWTKKLWWTSVEYVRDVELANVKKFNELFNSNFNRWQFVIIMQALWWYKIWWPVEQWINWFLRWINYSSSFARALMSYPFQLFTIAPQSIAYNIKANWYKRALDIEDMYNITRVREWYDILTSEYVELNPIGWMKDRLRIRNFFSKYAWDEIDELLRTQNVEMDDSIIELFWKSYDHATKRYTRQQFVQLLDATRDNANNIIDALMAQKFKNLAFVKALKYNNVMPFDNARAFEIFMKDINIPQSMKDSVIDAVRIYSWRIFKDMLWTWFSWLDKMYWANVYQNILIWLMNTINFRWAWWLNMFRQTVWKILSVAKILRFVWDRKSISQAVDFLKRTPEFSDLSQAMFNDMIWMWKLARFSDNGKRPDDDSEADFMDYCEWVVWNIDLVSQQWQWLMSFWPLRPWISMWEAIRDHKMHPEYYWDEYWIWALINTFVSNIWRNWKPVNFVVKALRVAQADWDMSSAWKYAAEHWHEISAWTLRFMLEEWYNDYWANTPLVYEVWWIPSFIAWEQWAGSDTAYLYKMRQAETWEYIKNIRAWKEWYDASSLFSQLMNMSQFLSLNKEAIKWVWVILWRDDLKSSKSAYWLDDMDEAYKDVPEWQEWRETWFILPKHEDKYTSYYDSIINVFTEWKNPWWANFIEWLWNFVQYWKVNPKADTNYFDAALEEFYTRIEEKEPGALKEILNNKEIMANTATSNTAWNIQIELSWAMDKLKLFEWDPEYNKYAAIIYKWTMSNVMYNELQDFAAKKTEEFKSMWYLPKKKDKYSASEIKDTPELYKEFKQQFVDKHWDDLMIADVEWMQWAMFKFLAENNREVSEKFFTYNEEYDKRYLKSNLKSQVQQLIDFENAMNDWDWERAIVQWTMLTKTFSYDHTVSSQTALHIINRIKDSENLSEEMKVAAMTEFVANNLDAFAWDSDLAKENPEVYEEVKEYYNRLNYQVNKDLINAANDYALSLSSDKDESWSWGKKWWLALKVKSLSEALRKNQQKTWWTWNWKTYTMTWIKAPIIDPTNIIVEDSKPAKIDFKFTTSWYTPKTDLGWWQKQQPTAQPVKVKKVKVKEKDIEVI